VTLETLIQSYNIVAVVPELVLALFGLAALLCGAFFPDSGRRAQPALALAGVVVCGVATAALWNRNLTFGEPATAVFAADNFSLFFKWIFLIGLAITILLSSRFLHARSGDRHSVSGEFYGLLIFCTVGMMMVASARDLLVVFLGLETFSIALYVLAGFARARLASNEAAMKYFLLGALSPGFFLYCIALTYAATGSTNLAAIAAISGQGAPGVVISMPILLAGAALLLIGLSFKAALVPFHQWTPDVYEGAPTAVTAFMATSAKAAAFAAILRVFVGALGHDPIATQWFTVMLVVAVLTMTIGNVVALAQTSLKRMLAYSSIAHAGYTLIGVVAAGSATRLLRPDYPEMQAAAARSVVSVLFYLLIYVLMTLGAFAVLVYLENARAENDPGFDDEDANLKIADLNGLAWRRPLAAAAMTVFLFSLAGIPPTAGFFAKLYLFQEGIGQGLIGLVLVGVLNSVISLYYYMRPVVAMYRMGEAKDAAPSTPLAVTTSGEAVAGASLLSSFAVGFAIALCAAGVLLMIVLQNVALAGAHNAAQLLPPM
jgi:NADH-quinone oxidoreductase subunit N